MRKNQDRAWTTLSDSPDPRIEAVRQWFVAMTRFDKLIKAEGMDEWERSIRWQT